MTFHRSEPVGRCSFASLTMTVCLLLAGCGDGPSANSTSPYPIVRNGDVGLWNRGEAWTLEPVWRIGGAGATEDFVFSNLPLSLSIGPKGTLAVADPGGPSVRIYDSGGEFVRNVGREGPGPGEWRGPIGVGWDPASRLWVIDQPNLRYTLYDSAGAYITEFERPPKGLPRLSRPGRFDSTGALLGEGEVRDGNGGEALFIFRISPTGEILDTLHVIPMPQWRRQTAGPAVAPKAPGNRSQIGEYRPKLVYTVTPTDIWFADSRTLRLVRQSHAGDTTLVVETAHRASSELDEEEKTRLSEELASLGLDEDFGWGRQVVQGLHVMTDASVLVLVDDDRDPRSTLDVFNARGQFLGSLELDFALDPESQMVSSGDTLFVTGRDEFDATFIAKFLVRRPGTD